MTLSLRARQVATVTALVVCSMVALASVNLTSLVRLSLEESNARGEMLARAIFHRARLVVPTASDPRGALRDDPGIRAMLESSIAYTESVTYAAIVDARGVALAHSSPLLEGRLQQAGVPLRGLLDLGAVGQLRGVYRDATLEIDEPLSLGDEPFGSIRVGLSTVLIRDELQKALWPAITALGVTLALGLFVSLSLARWALKPIHVIRAGLSQLERGEPEVSLELPPGKDFNDLGESFDAISARLSQREVPGTRAPLASVGRLLAGVAHEVKNPLNAMTIHLELIRQKLLQSSERANQTSPSRSVLGLSPPSEGGGSRDGGAAVLAETQTAEPGAAVPELLQHVSIIGDEVRRLDTVIQGFLRFIRPDDARHESVELPDLIDEVFALVGPEAEHLGIRLERRVQSPVPTVSGDRAGLRQALLNLALNACQAMPAGGSLRADAGATESWVTVDLFDTGVGMSPQVLERIFELYYTTKTEGSGIGLSMVYRIIKLHGGEIEVESTVGTGTRFRLMLPRTDVRATVAGGS